MKARLIIALAVALLCFAVSDARPQVVACTGKIQHLELAGAGDVDRNSFYGTTTLNLLVGGVAITFSGWILSKRKLL